MFLWCNQAKENSVSLVLRVPALRDESVWRQAFIRAQHAVFYQSLNPTLTVAACCHVRSCMYVWECMFKCGLVSLNTFPSQRTPFPLSLPDPVFFFFFFLLRQKKQPLVRRGQLLAPSDGLQPCETAGLLRFQVWNLAHPSCRASDEKGLQNEDWGLVFF